MIVASLLLILVAVTLLVLGLAGGSSTLLISSIVASLLAAVALVIGARQAAARRRQAAPAPAGDAPARAGAPARFRRRGAAAGYDEARSDFSGSDTILTERPPAAVPPDSFADGDDDRPVSPVSGPVSPASGSVSGAPVSGGSVLGAAGPDESDAPVRSRDGDFFEDPADDRPAGSSAGSPSTGFSSADRDAGFPVDDRDAGFSADEAYAAGGRDTDDAVAQPSAGERDRGAFQAFQPTRRSGPDPRDADPDLDLHNRADVDGPGFDPADRDRSHSGRSDFDRDDYDHDRDDRQAASAGYRDEAGRGRSPDFEQASSVIGAARAEDDQSWRRSPDAAAPGETYQDGLSDEFGEADDEDPADEPLPQAIRPGDAVRVARMDAEVLVVDGRPRYHLADCQHLVGRLTEALPASEAVELGFSPCGLCRPVDRLVAQAAHR